MTSEAGGQVGEGTLGAARLGCAVPVYYSLQTDKTFPLPWTVLKTAITSLGWDENVSRPVALGLSVATPEGRPSSQWQASAYPFPQPPGRKLVSPGAILGTSTSNLLT